MSILRPFYLYGMKFLLLEGCDWRALYDIYICLLRGNNLVPLKTDGFCNFDLSLKLFSHDLLLLSLTRKKIAFFLSFSSSSTSN